LVGDISRGCAGSPGMAALALGGVMAQAKRAGTHSPGTWAETTGIFTQIKRTVLSWLLIQCLPRSLSESVSVQNPG